MTEPEERAYRRGYSRGYNAGRRGSWPDHVPPAPNVHVVQRMQSALEDLRNAVDGELALFDADDDMAVKLSPFIDQATEALAGVSKWIAEQAD